MNYKIEPITGYQISLLKKSFRQLDSYLVAQRFYAKLFELYPEVKELFPTDMGEQGTKLMSVFELVVFSFEERDYNQFFIQDTILAPLRQLGMKHNYMGIERKHYDTANVLLIKAMHETGGDFFTEETAEAWKLALYNLTEAMLNTNIKLSPQVERDSGLSFRETFSYIKKKFLHQPD